MKKFLLTLSIVILSFGIMAGVQAVSFTLYVNPRGGTAASETMSSGTSTTYAVLYMDYVTGGDTYDIYLQTKYNNTWQSISAKTTINAAVMSYWAEFAPTDITYCRPDYAATITCSGANTTSSKCILANKDYRFYVVNGSWFGGQLSVTGSLLPQN